MSAFSPARTGGFSLVSLMVGSIISVFVIIVGMNFYKMQIQMSSAMKSTSQHNGRLSFFLTSLQMQLTRAGHGIIRSASPSNAQDFEIFEPDENSQIIAWRFEDDQTRCLGMQEVHRENQDGNIFVSLSLVEPTRTCALDDQLSQLTWQSVEPIARFQDQKLTTFLETNPWLVSYGVDQVFCAPFGLNVDARFRRARLQIIAPSYGVLAGDISPAGGNIQLDVCLNNIRI